MPCAADSRGGGYPDTLKAQSRALRNPAKPEGIPGGGRRVLRSPTLLQRGLPPENDSQRFSHGSRNPDAHEGVYSIDYSFV